MLEIQDQHEPRPMSSAERIGTGCRVRLLDVDEATEWDVTIVDSEEADPHADRISDCCPIGEALLGRKAGEVVCVAIPMGTVQYRVLSVSLPDPAVIGGNGWQPAVSLGAEMEEP